MPLAMVRTRAISSSFRQLSYTMCWSIFQHFSQSEQYSSRMEKLEAGDYKVALGRRIRALRTAQGISLRKFALMVGIDYGYLSNIETGKANITVDLLAKIADGLEVDLRDLF